MNLESGEALEFIEGYSAILLTLRPTDTELSDELFLHILATSREKLQRKPRLLDAAIRELKKKDVHVDPDIVEAIRTLKVGNWVYLRDTRSYSIFLDEKAEDAFAVLGLTERIRNITGESGVIIMTGIMCFRGRYICDGIALPVAFLGPNYRESYTESYRELKANGRFHRGCAGGSMEIT